MRLVLVWLLLLVLMIAAAGVPPVNRTQEARVLETAREMIGRPFDDWMIPKLNGHVRLRKPPLAYWASAASMTLFGENERAGRLPTVLLSWLSVGATFAVTRRWFDRDTAILSAGALAGSWLFFKHGMLAETDAYAAAGMTLGVYAIVRAGAARRFHSTELSRLDAWATTRIDPGMTEVATIDPATVGEKTTNARTTGIATTGVETPDARSGALPQRGAIAAPTRVVSTGSDVLWLHVVAVCLVGIVLAKGPPAAYLLLFWVGWCWVHREGRTLRRFVTRGGLATLLVLAVPWFVYVKMHTAAEGQLGADLANSADGGDHPGPPWAYVPLLIKATLPWTGAWVVALVMAGQTLLQARGGRRGSGESPHAPVVDGRGLIEDQNASTNSARTFTADPPRRRDSAQFDGPSDVLALTYLLLWGGAVLLPLCCWGNKQFHYLMPAMPPTMILVGWALAAAVRGEGRARAAGVVAMATAVLLMLTPVAALLAMTRLRTDGVRAIDVVIVGGLVLAACVLVVGWRKGRRPAAIALVSMAVVTMLAVHAWLPAVLGGRSRLASVELLQAFPNARFVFRTTELPVMSWSMRRAVPTMDDAAIIAAAGDVNLVVIDQQQDGEKAPVPPGGLVEARVIRQGDNTLHVYVAAAAK